MNEKIINGFIEELIPEAASRELVTSVLNSIPTPGGILDDDRRLVYPNKALLNALNEPAYNDSLYARPGELLKCINSKKDPAGCGSSKACELCGAFGAMKAARSEGKTESRDFRITTDTGEGMRSSIFKFTTAPFPMNGQYYSIFYLEDISSEIRQAELEKIFFHDILNSISSLHGIISLIKSQQEIEPQHLQILEASYNVIYDTVNEQRQIFHAEKGILDLRLEEIHSRDLIIENMLPFNENRLYKSSLEIAEEFDDAVFISDPKLLSRVITNMIKNAMEASSAKDEVRISCKLKDDRVIFFVRNSNVIPEHIQLQIFERSFSTKGGGRGLGTYSMKLLGEEYLKGIVGFESNSESGTVFWIDLPVKL